MTIFMGSVKQKGQESRSGTQRDLLSHAVDYVPCLHRHVILRKKNQSILRSIGQNGFNVGIGRTSFEVDRLPRAIGGFQILTILLTPLFLHRFLLCFQINCKKCPSVL